MSSLKLVLTHIRFKIIIFIILLTASLIRLEATINFFTHFDDIGVVHMLEPYMKGEVEINTLRTYNEAVKGISSSLTYAPLQYLFTVPLIDRKDSYHDLLFWGRLPSYIFGLIGLLIFVIILSRTFNELSYKKMIFPLMLLSLSWQNNIYSAHMSNYTLSMTLMYILFYYFQYRPYLYNRDLFLKDSILITLLIWGSYQFIFVMPAIILSLYLVTKNQKYYKYYLGLVLIVGINYALLYPYSLSEHLENSLSISWNVGINNQFYFQSPKGIINKILYPFIFFSVNTYKIILNHLSIFSESHLFNYLNSIIIIIFMFIGICKIRYQSRLIYLIIFFYSITYIGFVIIGKLAYSPTRHTMLFTPIMLILLVYGLKNINKKLIIQIISIWNILLFILFLSGAQYELEARYNYIQEDYVTNLAKEYKVTHVFYADCSPQSFYMKKLKPLKIDFIPLSCDGLKLRDNDYKPNINTETRFLYVSSALNIDKNEIDQFIKENTNREESEILFKKSIGPLREVGLSSEVSNFGNSLFLVIFK